MQIGGSERKQGLGAADQEPLTGRLSVSLDEFECRGRSSRAERQSRHLRLDAAREIVVGHAHGLGVRARVEDDVRILSELLVDVGVHAVQVAERRHRTELTFGEAPGELLFGEQTGVLRPGDVADPLQIHLRRRRDDGQRRFSVDAHDYGFRYLATSDVRGGGQLLRGEDWIVPDRAVLDAAGVEELGELRRRHGIPLWLSLKLWPVTARGQRYFPDAWQGSLAAEHRMNESSAAMIRHSEAELSSPTAQHESPPSWRARWRWHVVAVIGLVLVLCALLVDRPLALWLHSHFHGSSLESGANEAFRRVDQLLPAAGVLVLLLGAWFTIAKSAPGWLRHVVSGGLAAALSLGAAIVLKFMIGRSQVYPPFLRDGIYTFSLLHGRPDYGAFPSATMAVASALIVGLHLRTTAERAALVIATGVLTAALLVTNGHWLSDIIGGVCLGLVIGGLVARGFFARGAS